MQIAHANNYVNVQVQYTYFPGKLRLFVFSLYVFDMYMSWYMLQYSPAPPWKYNWNFSIYS